LDAYWTRGHASHTDRTTVERCQPHGGFKNEALETYRLDRKRETMNNLSTVITSLVSTSILLATTAAALAEPSDALNLRTMPAASNALELTIGASYAQGTGDLGGDMGTMQDVGPGGGVEASIGWRATPNLSIGGYANFVGFGDSDGSSNAVVTASAGLKVDWHFLPAASIDPWVSVGTGVKLLGIENGDDHLALTGFELAKVQVGVDYRVNGHFAIGPVIGASATMFTHRTEDVMSDDALELDDKKVNWTFSAGLVGRFDVFGTTR